MTWGGWASLAWAGWQLCWAALVWRDMRRREKAARLRAEALDKASRKRMANRFPWKWER
jgi:hypothetical protein